MIFIDFDGLLAQILWMAMATAPPYSTGIFETIVGIHFGDGLAVEFFDGAS